MTTDPQTAARKRRHREGCAPVKRSAEHGFTPVRRSAEHGFTLVELMVVIVILGLLATIVALNVIPQGERAKSEKAKADIATIENGLELYKLNLSNYPTTSQGLAALLNAPADLGDPSRYQKGGYIKKLPDDPWGRPYLYASPGTHGDTDIWTFGADGKEGGEGADADIGSWQ
ncbi:type II secretion system major pseudopilin GspG [Sphingomonas alpina]|uniref:Type II secretion system core protein G n=1 Tax=Sphingomonas alpina TaxID=653931 RepID=A0A7H0LMN3_9SPHN|nr:type II secretion system major pseudopilin GspG [Sphingomonas alpina]QNQ10936.1 type II secretion system major pseudopilin GspG [Sphingomonas alpina]